MLTGWESITWIWKATFPCSWYFKAFPWTDVSLTFLFNFYMVFSFNLFNGSKNSFRPSSSSFFYSLSSTNFSFSSLPASAAVRTSCSISEGMGLPDEITYKRSLSAMSNGLRKPSMTSIARCTARSFTSLDFCLELLTVLATLGVIIAKTHVAHLHSPVWHGSTYYILMSSESIFGKHRSSLRFQ